MAKIAVVGANGKMGTLICEKLRHCGHDVQAIDILQKENQDLQDIKFAIDLVVDFSNKSNSLKVLKYCEQTKTKLIMGTTGQGEFFNTQLNLSSKVIAIIKCDNFSQNIQKFKKLCALMSNNFDGEIAIVEAHHKNKQDFPSGTAKAIAGEIIEQQNNKVKFSSCLELDNEVVNTYSIRGGSIFGRHEVHYFGDDEEIVLSHTAYSRKPFVDGLIKAVEFILNTEQPNLYKFEDISCNF